MGYIAVDLDGTLAHYTDWKGALRIGEPVSRMRLRVLQWMREGKEVRLFTARASDPKQIPVCRAWLDKNGLSGIKIITNQKDFDMDELYDDRAFHVIKNTGMVVWPNDKNKIGAI